MVEFAVPGARQEAVDHAAGPATRSPASDGFPVLDNRRMLEAALRL